MITKYFNDAVIGNRTVTASFSKTGELLRLYSPTVDYKQFIERFNVGPAGIEALASTISEETVTLEDVNEPYLLQEGFIIRTHRGRVATDKAYTHLGIKRGGLF